MNKTPRRAKSPERRKLKNDPARKYSYSPTSSGSSESVQARSLSTHRTGRSDVRERQGSDAASEREKDKNDRKEKKKEEMHRNQKKNKEKSKERRSDSDSLSARETARGTIVMRRNETPREVNEKGRKKVDEQEANIRKIQELEKQVKELTAELAVCQEKEDRIRENQEVLDSVETGDPAATRKVDLLIERLLQILMNFSEGKFWPKGGDSFQTKVFQEYLETHFDMHEFRTFLKENFKELSEHVEKPL